MPSNAGLARSSTPGREHEHSGAGFARPSVHHSTLKELAAASPGKHSASLEQQLAGLQRDLKAKQAEVDAGKADLEYRQRLLRFAAGL